MESDTNTRKSSKRRKAGTGPLPKIKPRAGGLTLLILAVNIVPILVLVAGLLSLGQYRDNLIRESQKALNERARNFATAIGEGAVRPVETGKPLLFAKPDEIEMLIPELSRRMVRGLGESEKKDDSGFDTRIRLFDGHGRMIADSEELASPNGLVEIVPLDAPTESSGLGAMLSYIGARVFDLLPMKYALPAYPEAISKQISAYSDAYGAQKTGKVTGTAWQDRDGRIILTAAAPVLKTGQALGVIHLTNSGRDIETGMARVRYDVMTAALAALSLTIFMSLYLSGMIGRPLKNLALAAEQVRESKGRQIEIPDYSSRKDEIGELSQALRHMTHALWDRMDSIERFAADVSHELKNPLTSLRSAVETAAKVTKPEDREKLMKIIHHDVQRLDRLISDISHASRIDAELSREERGQVDLVKLLEQLTAAHLEPMERAKPDGDIADEICAVRLDIVSNGAEGANGPWIVKGSGSRLAQVFENLIGNALSFSPPGSQVNVKLTRDGNVIAVAVSDHGPGIPENKLETIFERFYSERPVHESYGDHSGLGLSIARQIVTAHSGEIHAENARDAAGAIAGARFIVTLPAA
jgi:two-component system sensor histidine kinase ChvG